MTRVFLHLGAPKTGTTYLQDTAAANRELFARYGVRYPETPSGTHFEAAIDLLDHHWGGALVHARGDWEKLAVMARTSEADVVVSHEVLAAATPEQADRALADLEPAEVHLVYSARDLRRQIPAEYQEQVKHRRAITFEQFLDELRADDRSAPAKWFWKVQDLPGVMRRWGRGVPVERQHVITVPPAGAEPEILWQRFTRVLGLPDDLPYDAAARHNSSMGAVETELIRRLNARVKGTGIPQEVYGHLVREVMVHRQLAVREDSDPVVVPEDLRPWVEAVSADWRDWLTHSGVDVVGDVDDLSPRWPQEPVEPPDVAEPELVDAALDALEAVLKDGRRQFRAARRAAAEEAVPLHRRAWRRLRA